VSKAKMRKVGCIAKSLTPRLTGKNAEHFCPR
jgi:hypothetical protein